MSVQLIIQPQNYQGFSNSNNTLTQFLVDGINFNNVNTSPNTLVTSILPQGAIDYYNPTMIVNTWYRYYDLLNTSVSKVGAFLSVASSATSTQNGLIQKLSNLSAGSVYDIEVNSNIIVGTARLLVYSGTILQSTHTLTGTATQTIQFTANSTEDTIVIDSKYTTISNLLQINSISIKASPSSVIQYFGDGQVILDLYEDEDLPLTFSVDDFKNVAENVQSYSKAFKLPATKRNSQIFDNIFEITRTVEGRGGLLFNPYKRSKCILKQDGLLLFQGFLRLLEITDKDGEISYNVNLYAEVVALADTLKDREFRDLDFSELVHDYNYNAIKPSWTGVLPLTNPLSVGSFAGPAGATTTDVLKYPFVDWNHQYGFTSAGMPKLPTLATAFRPFIKLKYLIERIFEASPFSFTSTFFDDADFNKLYMDFNWGSDNNPFTTLNGGEAHVDAQQIATSSFQIIQTNSNNFNATLGYSAGVYTAVSDNQTYNFNYSYGYDVTLSQPWSGTFQWILTRASGFVEPPINTQTVTGTTTFSGVFALGILNGNLNETLNIGDTLHAEFMSTTSATNDFRILVVGSISTTLFGTVAATYLTTTADASTNNTFLQTLRGETNQWEFLKGIITMFNLVTLPDEDNPNNIKIEPYTDVFINNTNKVLDWTEKIDTSEMKLTPLTDLTRKTIFKFVEDDDDYSFSQYKHDVGGHLYGSQTFDAGNEFNILDGEDEIIAEPFGATVVKPLDDDFPEFITPALYAMNDDATSEGFDNSPRIMYDNGVVTMGSTTYEVPQQNGAAGVLAETDFLQFSHLSLIPCTPSALDFHFGICQLMTGVGASTVNNLFNLYWLPYFSELYNPNTRTMTIKVNLTPADINTFQFTNLVRIKNRTFRVNKIDYKPNDLAKVEFILIA